MELRQLRYFAAVAEHESYTRASAHLLIAQPALSAQIAKLEDELGVALFEKAGRGIRLTVPGRLALAEAERTLAAADAVGSRAPEPTGRWERCESDTAAFFRFAR